MSKVSGEISFDYKLVDFTCLHDKITKIKRYQQVLKWI